MTGNALGFIETVGLTAAIEAADSAAKAANVRVLGYELAKGDGMATVKVEGDVGAVKAAVQAAEAAAGKVGRVVSVHVIPRPAEGTEGIVRSRETVGLGEPKKAAPPKPVPETPPVPSEAARPAGEGGETKKPRSQSKKPRAEGEVKPKPDGGDQDAPSLGLDN